MQDRWENLGISKDFLFEKVMEDPGLCKEIMEVILEFMTQYHYENVEDNIKQRREGQEFLDGFKKGYRKGSGDGYRAGEDEGYDFGYKSGIREARFETTIQVYKQLGMTKAATMEAEAVREQLKNDCDAEEILDSYWNLF